MFPYLFPLASPSLPPSLSHPSRWSQSTELSASIDGHLCCFQSFVASNIFVACFLLHANIFIA